MRTIGWRRLCEGVSFFDVIGGKLSWPLLVSVPLALFQVFVGGIQLAQAQTVHAVFFFAPTCQHCHVVITQYLPALFDNYGGAPRLSVNAAVSDAQRALFLFHNAQLKILVVDASKQIGTELYLASNLNQMIPPERTGVPRLVIGDVVLVGSLEIPEQTGDLVRQGLEQGGLGWPSIDGLDQALGPIPGAVPVVVVEEADSAVEVVEMAEDSSAAPADTVVEDTVIAREGLQETEAAHSVERAAPERVEEKPTTAVDTSASIEIAEPPPAVLPDTPSVFETIQTRRMTMVENFRLDPVGNSFSVVVLLVMIVSIALVWLKSNAIPVSWGWGAGIPLLAAVGAAVAAYLTYVEATGVIAVCGPVGDCNTVNQSDWARLFGIFPVGALGLLGYGAISLAWAASRYASEPVSLWARLLLLVLTVGGTLFSIYLTFLEPFVIGATCAWCLTSSVVITALMWLAAGSGRDAWVRIRDRSPAFG